MTVSKRIGIVVLAAIIGLGGLELAERISGSGDLGVVPTAEAKVGRPLTPVSVAGMARRTARRCAAGVYNC